ncbi:MAG: methyl-accepting chemotaxis protein [Paraglaciecola sp.]
MSLKARLLRVIISMVVMSILLMGGISINIAVNESTDALTDSVKERLTSQNEQTSEALLRYFNFIESQIRAKSYSLDVVEAIKNFLPAYNNYANDRGTATKAEIGSIESYYNVDFTNQYNAKNSTRLNSAAAALNGLNNNALALQHDFIASSAYALGEKDGLSELGNGTKYAQVHNKYHPTLRQFLQEFGYYDMFIVDVNNGNIIYSVFKEIDYATSLSTGPYADTGIAEAFKKAANANSPDEVFFSRFEQYRPSYDALSGFASTPIYANGRQIAVLIFQIPLVVINNILTHEQKWAEKGFGESGETYLVNDEGLLMNESRFFVDDKSAYLAAMKAKYAKEAKDIEQSDTTVGIQPVDSSSAKLALRGEHGFQIIADYRDVDVFSAYYPLKIDSYPYALMGRLM